MIHAKPMAIKSSPRFLDWLVLKKSRCSGDDRKAGGPKDKKQDLRSGVEHSLSYEVVIPRVGAI